MTANETSQESDWVWCRRCGVKLSTSGEINSGLCAYCRFYPTDTVDADVISASIVSAAQSYLTEDKRSELALALADSLTERQLIELRDRLLLRFVEMPELTSLVHDLVDRAIVHEHS